MKKNISVEDIRREYLDADCAMPQAAKNLGCSVLFLRNSIKNNGMKAKDRRWNMERLRKHTKMNDPVWFKEQIDTKTYNQIAAENGCNAGHVGYYARKHRIFRGTKSESIKRGIKLGQPEGRHGKNGSNWQGGRRRAGIKGCYVAIYSPDHPYTTKDSYVMEHRLVMEKYLGRHLLPTEIIHHKNGIKDDNRLENLELIENRGAHTREHFERSHVTETFQIENETLQTEISRLKQLLANNGISPE